MSGHLFVVHGDLESLACHDVLVPCDSAGQVSAHFASLLGEEEPTGRWFLPSGRRHDGPAARYEPENGTPQTLWLVDTARRAHDRSDAAVAWLVGQVRDAVGHVARHGGAVEGRARRLVALPSVGLGDGGFDGRRAAVIDRLLTALQDEASTQDVDIAWVLLHRSDYDAVQHLRQAPPVPRQAAAAVDALAARARRGELTFFLGAGVSIAAGLPSWNGLLRYLAEYASGLQLSAEELSVLTAPDAASVLERALGDGLDPILRTAVSATRHALAHGLIASMRPREVITTNYDDLYERAARVPWSGTVGVLPGHLVDRGQPWVLKLHGDAARSESRLVLTREHYLRFDSDAVPLAAVVQSRLLTGHVLFVGYSLSDDNFVRLARQVQQTLKESTGAARPVGTVLTLLPEPGKAELWRDVLDHVALVDAPAATVDPGASAEERQRATELALQEAARELEIVLDRLAWQARTGASYLLDPRYDELLSGAERPLAAALRELDVASRDVREPVGDVLRDLIESLGGRRADGST